MHVQTAGRNGERRYRTARTPIVIAAALAACLAVDVSPASSQSNSATKDLAGGSPAQHTDPFRLLNRTSFSFNEVLDRFVVGPVVRTYMAVTPAPMRRGLSNAVNNLSEPSTAVNAVLQGRPEVAVKATARFVANSTIGLLGLFDVAGTNGLEQEPADLGQTLGRYGVKPGPYIYLPLIGPTTLRDGLGALANALADPVSHATGGLSSELARGRMAVSGLVVRSDIEPTLTNIMTQSTDPYATIRSSYLQNRESLVREATGEVQMLPDFDDLDAVNGPAADLPPHVAATTEYHLAQPVTLAHE